MRIGNQVEIRETAPQELQENYAGVEMTVYTIVEEIAGNSIDPVVGVRRNTIEGAAGDFEYFHMEDLKVLR
jgi:hypothetical protein|tara:strand:- start:53 stop:265 length:213 start_codon:yes stop_codon:yes gene_type:complete